MHWELFWWWGGHCGINFIHQFPVYSFHMPLFIFISGYFFHAYDFRTFLTKKVKHLLVPFLLWNAFYWSFIHWLFVNGLTQIGHYQTVQNFFWNSLVCAWPTAFTGPSWFVIILFWTQLLYWFIHKAARENMFLVGAFCFAAYLLSLYLTFHGYSHWLNDAGFGLERTLFFLLFYFAGNVYRIYIETKQLFSLKRCLRKILLCFLINWVTIHFITPQITYNIHLMYYPIQSYWLPIITACTGICLYMQFAEIIINKVKKHPVLDFIGRHTYSVMTHHLVFFWLANSVLWLVAQHTCLANWFDFHAYMTNVYYQINTPYHGERFIYLISGLCGTLLCCWIYDRYIQQRWHAICSFIVRKALK